MRPVSPAPPPRGSERPLVGYGLLALAVAVLLSAGVVCSSRGSTAAASHAAPAAVVVQAFHQPTTLDELLALPAAELAKVDLARMNLLCGEGLPGCEHLDLAQSLAEVDAWAARVKEATDRQIGEFLSEHDAAHSEAQYRMMMVMSVLSQGYGIHYDEAQAIAEYGVNPAKMKPASDVPRRNLGPDFDKHCEVFFLNGLLSANRNGNCSSLPVLVTAVARRLGYPVSLVCTFRHTFVRWDDGKERFNVETTVTDGLQVVTDDRYLDWPVSLSTNMIMAEDYLRPLSPTETLALFLYTRACGLVAYGRVDEAEKYQKICAALLPSSRRYDHLPVLEP